MTWNRGGVCVGGGGGGGLKTSFYRLPNTFYLSHLALDARNQHGYCFKGVWARRSHIKCPKTTVSVGKSAHTHTTYTHTTRKHTRLLASALTQAHAGARARAHTHARTHAHSLSHTHARTRARTQARTHAHRPVYRGHILRK